jgi:hypothetical protein
MKYLNFTIISLLFCGQLLFAQKEDSSINFLFTSDVHFGLVKEKFRGKEKVSAFDVNMEMAKVMNNFSNIDGLVITGDIANRMENGVQTASKSWSEFKHVFIDSLHVKKTDGSKADLWVVPGNHDMSNAIGFHRPMIPKKDPASMLGIYNLVFPDKNITLFDSNICRVHYSKDIKGVHFIFLSLYPDSAERVWMEKDLEKIKNTTPVLLFAHSIPDVEPRFFENPNGIHDINEEDKFENLVPERYKDGKDVKGETTLEQLGFVNFIKKHPNIKAYFHGHENFTEFYDYKGPVNDIHLPCIRTDSPMKGRISLKDETKLAFELVSINTKNQIMTVKEVLWNANMNSQKFEWGQTINITL